MNPDKRLGHATRMKHVAKRIVRFADYIKRCVHVESLSITPNDDGTLTVRAKWPGGSYCKQYELDDLYRTCRTRRSIIGDILQARGVR